LAVFDPGHGAPVQIVPLEYDPAPISRSLVPCPCGCGGTLAITLFAERVVLEAGGGDDGA
jgi:hypothetical protein